MSTRPVRQSSKDAAEKIRSILEWENCAESSELFKLAAARMNEEFEQVKRRRTQVPAEGYATPTEDDGEDSEDDGSAPDSDDVESIFSQEESESDNDSLSACESTDVEEKEPTSTRVDAEEGI